MAKRMQEQKGQERSVTKSKSTAMNLSSHVPTCSSSAKSSIASQGPGILIATVKPESRMRRNSKSDAASSSQVRLQDAYLGGLMDTATVTPESETWSFQGEAVLARPIACKRATEKPNASSKSDHSGSPKAERKEWSHNLHVSPATVHHTEAVFSIVRGIFGREHDDPKDDLDVDMVIWGIFMNATLRVAVHLGQDCEAN